MDANDLAAIDLAVDEWLSETSYQPTLTASAGAAANPVVAAATVVGPRLAAARATYAKYKAAPAPLKESTFKECLAEGAANILNIAAKRTKFIPGKTTDPLAKEKLEAYISKVQTAPYYTTLLSRTVEVTNKSKDFNALIAVNLAGFFHLTTRVVKHMLDRDAGHIVNVSTTLAEYADSTTPAALQALTKGGLVAATRSLAIEYASRGLRINAVSLGVIKTPLHDESAYAGMGALHPLGRVGEIEDVVRGVLYLESAPFVTGEVLHIDGGQSAGH